MTLQVFYTTKELSVIFNRQYNATRRILNHLQIPPNKIGKTVIYYLSDIKDQAPKLYDSMVEAIVHSDVVEIPSQE